MLHMSQLEAVHGARAVAAAHGLRPTPLSAADRHRAEALFTLAAQVRAARTGRVRRSLLSVLRLAGPRATAAITQYSGMPSAPIPTVRNH